MSDTPTNPAPSGDTQNNPPCHCPECGKTTTFEHELSDRCAVCGHFVGRGELPPLNTDKKPKGPLLSKHPFVTSGDILVDYRTDCPVCEKTTQWRADVTGSRCVECRKIFVSRGRLKNVPAAMSKAVVKSPHPFAAKCEVIYYDANCPDCKQQTRWCADVAGSRCSKCGCFVRREIIKDVPVITPKDAVKPPQPSVVSEEVEKCIVCSGDEPCSHDFDAMAAQEAQWFTAAATKAAPTPEKPYTGPPEDYLNDAAISKLIMAANKARLHTAEEISHLLEWAHRAHLESCLLDMVLNGRILFQWSPGVRSFSHLKRRRKRHLKSRPMVVTIHRVPIRLWRGCQIGMNNVQVAGELPRGLGMKLAPGIPRVRTAKTRSYCTWMTSPLVELPARVLSPRMNSRLPSRKTRLKSWRNSLPISCKSHAFWIA